MSSSSAPGRPHAGIDSEPRAYDPEFDVTRHGRQYFVNPYFHEHQRLVANPFLALASLIPWMLLFRHVFVARHLGALIGLLALVAVIPCLLQYHCLDCGATGMLFRWRRHACARVLARQVLATRGRFRGPNPTTQTVLWGYAIVIVALLTAVYWAPH
jgi:hypothetical protein